MIRIPIKAYSKAALDALANPMLANQPEAVIWTLWDTQSAVSGLTTLTYFTTVQAAPQDGDLETAGQLPDPQYFQVWGVGFDVLQDITNIAAADQSPGPWRDTNRLVMQGRGMLLFTISTKPYVRVPTSFLHGSGGVTGGAVYFGAASNGIQYANNSIPDGGYYTGGAVVIPPKQAFSAQITYPAAVTLAATVNTRLWLYGVLFRRVL